MTLLLKQDLWVLVGYYCHQGLLHHDLRVVVVVVMPLCDNVGLQECGREEHSASPTQTF